MSPLAENLHSWSIEELSLVCESGFTKIPLAEDFRVLLKGKNKRIWTYVVSHVRSQFFVLKVKQTLYIKQLLEQRTIFTVDEKNVDIEKLQTEVSNVEERRIYLKRSLSIIEDRLINTEQRVKELNDHICYVNQKMAFLELSRQDCVNKDLLVKHRLDKILWFKNALNNYPSKNACSRSSFTSSLHNRELSDSNSVIKYLIADTRKLIKENFEHDTTNIVIIENFQNSIVKFKASHIQLIDCVLSFKEMCEMDLQEFVNEKSKIQPVEDFLSNRNKSHGVKQFLTCLKYKNIHDFLQASRKRKEVDNILSSVEEIIKLKIREENCELFELQTQYNLIKILTENEGISRSNKYLNEYLETLLKENRTLSVEIQQNPQTTNFKNVYQNFSIKAGLTFYFAYTSKEIFFKILNELDSINSFSHSILFESCLLPTRESLHKIKKLFFSDIKLMWKYCEETKSIQPLSSNTYEIGSPVLVNFQKYFHMHGFQNMSALCENLFYTKRKLQKNILQHCAFANNDKTDISKLYAKFIHLLEKMKYSIEKGNKYIDDAMMCHDKVETLIQDWWNQSAQFILNIEHEDKTLEMWLDILKVLPNFEVQNHS